MSQDGHAARVKSVEHLGADSIVLCEIEGQPVSVRQDGFSKAAPGDDDQACLGRRSTSINSIRVGGGCSRLR